MFGDTSTESAKKVFKRVSFSTEEEENSSEHLDHPNPPSKFLVTEFSGPTRLMFGPHTAASPPLRGKSSVTEPETHKP